MRYLILIVAFLFSGCVGFKELKPMNYFSINSSSSLPKRVKYPDKTVKVAYPLALNRELGYNMDFEYIGGKKGSYLNSQWQEPLARLIRANIINSLNSAKVFKATLPLESSVIEDYRVEVTVNSFKNVIENGVSYAVVDIDVSLVNMNNRSILKRRKFKYKKQADSLDAKGYAKAVNEIFKEFDRDLINWI